MVFKDNFFWSMPAYKKIYWGQGAETSFRPSDMATFVIGNNCLRDATLAGGAIYGSCLFTHTVSLMTIASKIIRFVLMCSYKV